MSGTFTSTGSREPRPSETSNQGQVQESTGGGVVEEQGQGTEGGGVGDESWDPITGAGGEGGIGDVDDVGDEAGA
jgi:hypothetical protein